MSNKTEDLEIRFLKPVDAVRKRPGMYIGATDNANVLLREIVDNSTDEIYAGYGNSVIVSNGFNGDWNFVADCGRGIPITFAKDKPNTTQALLSISELHAGSKFEGSDAVRSGLHGCGSSAVNFLSRDYILMSKITEENYDKSIPAVRDCWESAGPRSKKDLFYIVVHQKGKLVFEGAGKLNELEKNIFKECGKSYTKLPTGLSTIVLFRPDPEIFASVKTELPVKNLQYFLLIQEKFYKKKVEVIVNGQSIRNSFKPYKFEFVKTLIPSNTTDNKQIGYYITFEADENLGKGVEDGSVNGLDCSTGIHMNWTKNLFKAALKDYYKIKHDCLMNGFKFNVVVLANEVNFSSQTKENLRGIKKVTQKDFLEIVKEFEKVFKKNSDYWNLHITRLNMLADSMKKIGAAEKAQEMIDSARGRDLYKAKLGLADGFADATCGKNERMNAELYLCEGLSPGSSLKAGRKSPLYHAVLPLRGKVLNVSEKSAEQMLDNKELSTLFKVIGLGLDSHNVTNGAKTPEEAWKKICSHSRYGKICIATDADPDGLSIQSLILYNFSKFARFLIDFGMVYIAESPEFIQDGKYFYPSDPKQPGTILPVGLNPNKSFEHIKGLGSLDQSEVYDAFYNPATRRLVQVTPEGLDYARKLVEDITKRKQLLIDKGVLTNPFNLK